MICQHSTKVVGSTGLWLKSPHMFSNWILYHSIWFCRSCKDANVNAPSRSWFNSRSVASRASIPSSRTSTAPDKPVSVLAGVNLTSLIIKVPGGTYASIPMQWPCPRYVTQKSNWFNACKTTQNISKINSRSHARCGPRQRFLCPSVLTSSTCVMARNGISGS